MLCILLVVYLRRETRSEVSRDTECALHQALVRTSCTLIVLLTLIENQGVVTQHEDNITPAKAFINISRHEHRIRR